MESLLLCQMLLLEDHGLEVGGVRGRAAEPLVHDCSEDIRLEVVRSIARYLLEHVGEISVDSFVARVMHHIDAHIQFFPKGNRSSHPGSRGGGVNKWSMEQGDI